ncbi:hypothetical protein DPMN_189156 [Dreissena polymorpha]|uniref:Uncharacterized protein n=1 Tax=Dreissena polymorpha TaxID=45954 RepID=A0A9D4I980_DREPO|nr:hypothetical protein DPMN_189156 [Dreissena polymorpha]
MKLTFKTKRITKNSRNRFDLERLTDTEIADAFQASNGGKFEALNVLDNYIT